jgi:hypothetical protein
MSEGGPVMVAERYGRRAARSGKRTPTLTNGGAKLKKIVRRGPVSDLIMMRQAEIQATQRMKIAASSRG